MTAQITKYRLAVAERFQGRNRNRLHHVIGVVRVRIGTRYNGEPMFTEYTKGAGGKAGKALCGANVVLADGEVSKNTVSCSKCKSEWQKATAEGSYE